MKLHLGVLFLVSVALTNGHRFSEKIVGGSNATPGTAPYMAALRQLLQSHLICSAAILSPTNVLTAAHCFDSPTLPPISGLQIVVGTYLAESSQGGVAYLLKNKIVHSGYIRFGTINDIALLQPQKSIEFNVHVQPIALGTRPVPDGAVLKAFGWGLNIPGTRTPPPFLQTLDLTKININLCRALLPGIVSTYVTDGNFCTVNSAGNLCQGDSGGPLVFGNKLVGISSFGSNPCGAPDVHTRIHYFFSWISGYCTDCTV